MRHTLAVAIPVLLLACGATENAPETPSGLSQLMVMSENYPRAYFFRSSERPGHDPSLTYENWERRHSRLMGIEGKVLDEEIPELSKRNIEFFTRFKQGHPDQIALLHFNGNARDPNWQTEEFFAGHWIYFQGATVTADVPAEEGKMDIQVSDPSLFHVNIGRYNNRNEDIGICELDDNGRPNWLRSEQVKLISVDVAKNTIRVQRGSYGTRPRAFRGGKAYAASHVQEGQWGPQEKSNLMWYYNYSTDSPRDAEGRSCADVLIADIVERFADGGELELLDGVEFDVLRNTVGPHDTFGRGFDTNGDGKPDAGIVDGLNKYGLGVVEFCRRLREAFPADKLLLADGMGRHNQRAFQILNGIESEGFPHLLDIAIKDWSGGLNRHYFWDANARAPKFNYINHKFIYRAPGEKIPHYRPEVPFGTHRTVFAVSTFTNAAVCFGYSPKAEPGETAGIWDELRMGTANKLGWLGKPVGPAVRMAERTANLLAGSSPDAVLKRFGGEAKFSLDGSAVRIESAEPDAISIEFTVDGLPASGPDLCLTFTVRSAPPKGWPPEMARQLSVAIGEGPGKNFMTWTNADGFRPVFYFNDISSSTVKLDFAIDGGEPLWISDMTVHAHPDAMYREFENGLVVANPSPRPYTFELDELFPASSFRRLQGSSKQDTETNDGSAVSGPLTLPPKDALFLVKDN